MTKRTRSIEEAFAVVSAVVADHPRGQCYVASEAIYHLAGGKRAGLTPVVLSLGEGASHWWLRDARGKVWDATAAQFAQPVDYTRGRGCGFLTRRASKMTRALLARIAREEA